MLKLLIYLKPYILLILLMLGLTYAQVMASLSLPDYMAKIVNEGIVNQDQALIWSTGVTMILITLGGGSSFCNIRISCYKDWNRVLKKP